MSKIVDLSHHQKSSNIDWAKAAKEVDLMILRVQYGSSTVDREYKNHVANCKKYGIPFGSYAYGCFVSVEDAKVEARDLINRADKESKFLVLDTENDTISSCGTANVAKASQAFIDTLKAAGYKTGFYVSHHLHNSYGLNTVQADFKWIPRYGVTKEVKPNYPCDLWQYTETGRVSWYGGNLDLNKLNGDKTLDWFIGKEVVVAKKEEDIMSQKFEPSNEAIINAVRGVLYGFETVNDRQALSDTWRFKFDNGELSISDAIGLLYVAKDRGYID